MTPVRYTALGVTNSHGTRYSRSPVSGAAGVLKDRSRFQRTVDWCVAPIKPTTASEHTLWTYSRSYCRLVQNFWKKQISARWLCARLSVALPSSSALVPTTGLPVASGRVTLCAPGRGATTRTIPAEQISAADDPVRRYSSRRAQSQALKSFFLKVWMI